VLCEVLREMPMLYENIANNFKYNMHSLAFACPSSISGWMRNGFFFWSISYAKAKILAGI